ncbi:sterol desaturase family protein [Paraliomyxa miuraensis]|uniref:sterol desaturase family protein n=1 Tax=Paraliomyxa miuraensis TaxID=376150 RepID=UPI0022541C38|nr:sterol desaturase family protein [Paraliomyxa miuraensis]MCX4244889.1 sterol desaturase family protein [Paraliomyxa miuraensis]
MALHSMLLIVLLISGVLLLAVKLAYHWAPLSSARINPEPRRKLWGWRLYPRVVANMALSGSLVFVLVYATRPWLIVEGEPSWARLLLDAVAVLLVYDFLYYFMHRFAFHRWPLRKVHVVHHAVRHPHAIDSLYLHPLETFLGLALLVSCSVALGPVHPATFCVVFAVYSFLNILVHSGLNLPFFPFRALSYLARKHDVHHTSMKGGNYASLTPIFDKLFGTAE